MPFTVSVKAEPPAVALLGLRDVIMGGINGVIVKFTGTVTELDDCEAIKIEPLYAAGGIAQNTATLEVPGVVPDNGVADNQDVPVATEMV